VKILAISDVEVSFIYSPHIVERFKDTDLVISCGDLSYFYLEYIISMLNVPLCYVRGNHAHRVEEGVGGTRQEPWGGIDLHRRVVNQDGLLLSGLQGSLQYNEGKYQYSQSEMWVLVWMLTPRLFLNRLRYGRFLDVFVSHAPAWGVHDQQDRPHQGLRAFRWLIQVFKPALHLHGHIHVYHSNTITETLVGSTRVINAYGYREIDLDGKQVALSDVEKGEAALTQKRPGDSGDI
jgi:uncharacterized protein